MKVYVLTRCINAYEQDGEYFVAVFKEFPSIEEYSATIGAEVNHLLTEKQYENLVFNDGGRMGFEYEWYYIREEMI